MADFMDHNREQKHQQLKDNYEYVIHSPVNIMPGSENSIATTVVEKSPGVN